LPLRNKAEQQKQILRKVAPFFQSIEDIQYTTLKHRKDLIFLEAFRSKGGAAYLERFNRFTGHPDFFAPSGSGGVGTVWQKAGTGRYAESTMDYIYGRYLPGFNVQNI
jgi:hypothetical protein